MGSGDLNSVSHACRALLLSAKYQTWVFDLFVLGSKLNPFSMKIYLRINNLQKKIKKLPSDICDAQVLMADYQQLSAFLRNFSG